jgi:hypothetical protein
VAAPEAEVVEGLDVVEGPDVLAGLGSPEGLEASDVVVVAAVGLSVLAGAGEVAAGAVVVGTTVAAVVVADVVVEPSVVVVVAASVVVGAGAIVVVVVLGTLVGAAVAVLARGVVAGSDEVVLAREVGVARRAAFVESVVFSSTTAGAVRLLPPAPRVGAGRLGIRLAVLGWPEGLEVVLVGGISFGCVAGPAFWAALTAGLADLERCVGAVVRVNCPTPWAVVAEAAPSSVAIAATTPWPTGGPALARCFTASAASSARERSSTFCSAAA